MDEIVVTINMGDVESVVWPSDVVETWTWTEVPVVNDTRADVNLSEVMAIIE